jgi:DNA-binding transcriptional MerR regulator
MNGKLVSAKELAARSNISYAAINNYTDMGLLDIVAKEKRLRMYDFKLAQERLSLITKLITEGYTLRIIRKLLT